MAVQAVCNICNKEFAKKYSLRGHLQKYHASSRESLELPSFACPFCPKSAPYQFELKRHIRSLHCKPYRCIIPSQFLGDDQEQCNANFSTLAKLVYHICSVHKDRWPKADIREIIVANSDPVIAEFDDFQGGFSVLETLPAICPFESCKGQYANLHVHQRHMSRHSEPPHRCRFCKVRYALYKELSAHWKDPTSPCKALHEAERALLKPQQIEERRPITCELCGAFSTCLETHKRHLKQYHVKPFMVCSICGYKTRITNLMNEHKAYEERKRVRMEEEAKKRALAVATIERENKRLRLEEETALESLLQLLQTSESVKPQDPVSLDEGSQENGEKQNNPILSIADGNESDCESVIVCIQSDCDSPRCIDFSASPIVCIPMHYDLFNRTGAEADEVPLHTALISSSDEESDFATDVEDTSYAPDPCVEEQKGTAFPKENSLPENMLSKDINESPDVSEVQAVNVVSTGAYSMSDSDSTIVCDDKSVLTNNPEGCMSSPVVKPVYPEKMEDSEPTDPGPCDQSSDAVEDDSFTQTSCDAIVDRSILNNGPVELVAPQKAVEEHLEGCQPVVVESCTQEPLFIEEVKAPGEEEVIDHGHHAALQDVTADANAKNMTDFDILFGSQNASTVADPIDSPELPNNSIGIDGGPSEPIASPSLDDDYPEPTAEPGVTLVAADWHDKELFTGESVDGLFV